MKTQLRQEHTGCGRNSGAIGMEMGLVFEKIEFEN